MAKALLRDKARILRSHGLSFNEIVARLGVPKSTVRFWCRDIVLSKRQRSELYKKQKIGGILAAEKIRRKRLVLTEELLREGIAEIGKISQRDLLLVGTALYWAEGYRKGDGEFGFTNADPKMIELIVRWLQESCGVSKEKIKLRVCINKIHRNRIHVVQRFWAGVTKIPLSQFSNPTFINLKNRKRYLNQKEHFGTLRVKVKRSTNLRRKILGRIVGLVQYVEKPLI